MNHDVTVLLLELQKKAIARKKLSMIETVAKNTVTDAVTVATASD